MLMIGGIKQSEALKLMKISRATLNRYRKRPDWPGDDAAWAVLHSFVIAVRGNGGRRAGGEAGKQGSVEAGTGKQGSGEEVDPYADCPEIGAAINDTLNLDQEAKRTAIEVNKTKIREYQKRCIAEHRERFIRSINKALDRLFIELDEANLSPAQLKNIRAALRRAQAEIAGDDAEDYQPELL